jgi:hypothetical protein
MYFRINDDMKLCTLTRNMETTVTIIESDVLNLMISRLLSEHISAFNYICMYGAKTVENVFTHLHIQQE